MINTTNENVTPKTLLVSCADSVSTIDKTTFDSCVIQGMRVTFWEGDEEDMRERVNKMFDVLFAEVVKSRDKIRV